MYGIDSDKPIEYPNGPVCCILEKAAHKIAQYICKNALIGICIDELQKKLIFPKIN